MIHHLKIYPEHFSAVCTGIKRAELRKNDRDFKVGDTLHLMETPKGSCNPTGEFINAVVTHIADVGEWLPGYVMLSIEREHGYTAPQLPQSLPEHLAAVATLESKGYTWHGGQFWKPPLGKAPAYITGEQPVVPDELSREEYKRRFMDEDDFDDTYRGGWNACRAAMLQGAENVESRCAIQTAPILDSLPKNADSRCGNSPAVPDGWVLVPKEPTPDMLNAAWVSHGIYHASAYRTMLAAAPQQVK